MGNELLLIIGFTIFSLVVTMAWVGGYLDKYQQYVFALPIFPLLHQIGGFETCVGDFHSRSMSWGLLHTIESGTDCEIVIPVHFKMYSSIRLEKTGRPTG